MDKKEIQRNRMMKYFIDATVHIMKEESIEQVTIRKVADIAGYNSATIYNYFQELSHLIFFAAMTFLKDYTDALSKLLVKEKNAMEKYLMTWECFCKYSFADPKIYHAIFSSNIGNQQEELLKNYYTIFPTDIIELPEEMLPMVLESNLAKRGRVILEKCVKEGVLKPQNAEEINEMAVLVWQGMLTLLLNNRRHYSTDEAVEKTMKYIRQLVYNANQFDF